MQMVKGVHQPLVSEGLFQDVQRLLKSRERQFRKKISLNYLFPLRGYLTCPYCNRRLSSSFSQRKTKKYGYYHCSTSRCKGRFGSDKLEETYEELLKKIHLQPETYDLFDLILQDENILTARRKHLDTRKSVLEEISKQEMLLAKARHLRVIEKIDDDDFNGLKRDYKENLDNLNDRLTLLNTILDDTDNHESEWIYADSNIFQSYQHQDIASKRFIIELITPSYINLNKGNIESLKINKALSKIFEY